MDIAAPEAFIHLKLTPSGVHCRGVRKQSFGSPVGRAPGETPDGVFAYWAWNNGRLEAANDRLGFYPLYYYHKGGEIALSPSIPRLLTLNGDNTVDNRALAVFLRVGFFIGEDTPFTFIRALPPSARLCWEEGTLDITNTLPLQTRETRLPRRDAVEAYGTLFRAAVRRRRPASERCTVPLSGGCDSRHVVLELHAQGYRPECVTAAAAPPFSVDESGLAGEIATRLGLPHHIVHQSGSWLGRELRKNHVTNFCADEHSWFFSVADALRGALTVYDGIGGDMLSTPVPLGASLDLCRKWLGLYRKGRLRELAEEMMPYENTLRRLLTSDTYKRLDRELAVQHLQAELTKFERAASPLASFYLFNRTRREIALAPYSMLHHVPSVHSPFLDRELFDFLGALPPEMILQKNLHVETLDAFYPRVADVPFAAKQHASRHPPRAEAARLALDTVRFLASGRRSDLLRHPYLFFQIARTAVNPAYLGAFISRPGPLSMYLTQLERYRASSRTDRFAGSDKTELLPAAESRRKRHLASGGAPMR